MENEVKKMIDLTSIALVAFGSGSLLIAFADYATKCKRVVDIDVLPNLSEVTKAKS